MNRLLKEIQDDVNFVRAHTLQPRWYKALKIFILAGFLAGYAAAFGLRKAAVFLAAFLFLSLLLHLAYRAGTHKFTRSWLDFVVEETSAGPKAKSIGRYYYAAILLNAAIAVLLSQLFPG